MLASLCFDAGHTALPIATPEAHGKPDRRPNPEERGPPCSSLDPYLRQSAFGFVVVLRLLLTKSSTLRTWFPLSYGAYFCHSLALDRAG